MTLPVRSRTAALLATLCLLTASGCSSDDGGDERSDPPPSSASDPTDDPTDASESSEPTGSSGPTPTSVAPAVGQTVDLESLSLVLPDDFVDQGGVGNGLLASKMYVSESLGAIVTISTLTDITTTLTLEEAAQLGADGRDPGLMRQPDREVGGQDVYAFAGMTSLGDVYQVGRVAGDQKVTLDFAFGFGPLDEAVVESILASVTWKA